MRKYLSLIVLLFIMLPSFSYSNYPRPNYKYYIVKEPMVVKKSGASCWNKNSLF